jgi:triphosphatase
MALQEIELKFQVPLARRAAVLRAVATAASGQTRLQACYVDTPERHLARAHTALRLRKEGAHWVQTLKAQGDGPLHRLEHEVALPPGRGKPVLDLRRHAGTPAATALARALGLAPTEFDERVARGDSLGLAVVFETDIQRTHRLVRVAGGKVELAFDQGHIRAGGRSLPVCELEMELCAGTPAALVGLAQRWVLRHGLWLDDRSKAERGMLLAAGQAASPPRLAESPRLTRGMHPGQALRAMVRSSLAQVLANASVLADSTLVSGLPAAARAEHLHQWRVGLRRLRTALAVFGDVRNAGGAEDEGGEAGARADQRPPSTQIDTAWPPALAALFRRLGPARDRDALSASLMPALQLAGSPCLQWPAPDGAAAGEPEPGDLARSTDFTLLMLALLGWSHDAPGPDLAPLAAKAQRHWLRDRLAPLQRHLTRGAKTFEQLDDAARHQLRKRLKRLRYSIEFVRALLPRQRYERQIDGLKPVQEALGRYHDLCVAQPLFEAQASTEPRAWWVVGWLAAQRPMQVPKIAVALRSAAKVRLAWHR